MNAGSGPVEQIGEFEGITAREDNHSGLASKPPLLVRRQFTRSPENFTYIVPREILC